MRFAIDDFRKRLTQLGDDKAELIVNLCVAEGATLAKRPI